MPSLNSLVFPDRAQGPALFETAADLFYRNMVLNTPIQNQMYLIEESWYTQVQWIYNSMVTTTAPILWVSGTTYTIGDVRVSPTDLQSYRRKSNGAGTTDPKLDTTNWVSFSTSTNNPVFTGSYVQFPVGTTAERPSSPTVGMLRTNSTINNSPEYYDGNQWQPVTPEQYIGISYDTSTETMTRLGVNAHTPIGTMLPKDSPVLRNIARVLLSDAGIELNEISWTDKTKDIYGATVDRTGASGQVMVRLNKVYFSSSTVGSVYTIKFAETQLLGFSPWPGFDVYSKMYMGAYEASLSGGKYFSAAGSTVFPNVNVNSEQQDAYCVARGSGWMQENVTISLLVRTLCLVAWGTYDSSKWVGATTVGAALGRVNLSGGSWANDSYIGRCGLGDVSSGTGYTGTIYGSAVTQGSTLGYLTDSCQVLGVENLWGNVWTRVASLENNGAVYHKLTSPVAGTYASTTGWLPWLTGANVIAQLPTSAGWARSPLAGQSLGFPASVAGGASNIGMFDQYWYGVGLMTLLVGGGSDYATAGAFFWAANYSATNAYMYIGGRLCFMK